MKFVALRQIFFETGSEARAEVDKSEEWRLTGWSSQQGTPLQTCAIHPSGVITKIFHISLAQATIPPCSKSATIIAASEDLNDY